MTQNCSCKHWWMSEKKRVANAKLNAWCYLKGLKSLPEFVQADLVLVSLLLEALQLKNVIIITKCAKCSDISEPLVPGLFNSRSSL